MKLIDRYIAHFKNVDFEIMKDVIQTDRHRYLFIYKIVIVRVLLNGKILSRETILSLCINTDINTGANTFTSTFKIQDYFIISSER